nr:PREDICTED: ankyrin repeat domain-containing protein 7-like [Tribolium castaneum]|eukprot:XP_015840058.1 PREDICTED: ankyrin repeat domain-containing protein 7-like [Tribolium castaneum]
MVVDLIRLQADLNHKNINGYTPLHAAARNGHLFVVQLLIENGADLGAIDNFGNNALVIALKNSELKVADYLAKKIEQYNMLMIKKE